MSVKMVIQGLEDSELIELFLDFIQTYHLQYDKHHKEISYKCFEATWTLSIVKATGYGRTQSQAYKNALKNILQLLMEDPAYLQHFAVRLNNRSCHDTITKNHELNIKSVEDKSPPPRVQLKTQGHDPQDKKQYQSYSKIHYLPCKKPQVLYSKINLSRSNSHKQTQDLQEAKKKLARLENKYAAIIEENMILKEKLVNHFETKQPAVPNNKQSSTQIKEHISVVHNKQKPSEQYTKAKNKGILAESCDSLNLNDQKFYQKNEKHLIQSQSKPVLASKMTIPKLNLQVLPNYHKKSQKCLNQMLLAVYNDKHKVDKRML